MFPCFSGRHVWTHAEDAAKCCAPGWVRVLVIAQPDRPLPTDAANIGTAGGTLYGYVWQQDGDARKEPPCEQS